MKIKYLLQVIIIPFVIISSCYEAITEKALTNEKVVLSAPVDNLITTDSITTFFWEPMDAATKYQLQIVSPKFDSILKVYADTIITKNLFPFSLNKGKKFQWRVKAKNSSSETEYSQKRTLTIL
jgi:hypothetical protein